MQVESSVRKCANCLRFKPLAGDLGKCRYHDRQVEAADVCEDFADDIQFQNTKDGWFVYCGRTAVGPFQYLEDIDYIEVAAKLGVDGKQLFKAKMRAYKSPSPPIEVDADVIELEDFSIHPVFNGLSQKIHPAIGVVDDIAYVGVVLPCIVQGKKGVTEKELPFLITSDRQKILCNNEVLSKLKWKLAYRVVNFENRWSLKSIEQFLNGSAKVDPAAIYKMVRDAWKSYIEFDREEIYDFLTLWSIGTYFFHLFNAYPYVYIGGLKRSGKTKVLTVASLICFNAIFSNNMSTPSIFRLIQSGRCTLLMDETEKLSSKERGMEIRNLLLSGYKKGAKVYRTEKTSKERLIPEAFEVYSPKMIANISGIEDVLEDRCITIIMKRGKNKKVLNSEPQVNDPLWQEIRNGLYLLYLTHFSEVSELSEQCEGGNLNIAERELELWKPIFTMAKFFDSFQFSPTQSSESSLYSLMLKFAEEKVREKQIENVTETGEYILVQTLLKLVKEDRYYKVKEVRDLMSTYFDEEQKWLTTAWVGRALRRLGFTEKRRVGTGYEYLLRRQEVEDLAERLGVAQNEPSQPNQQSKLAKMEEYTGPIRVSEVPSKPESSPLQSLSVNHSDPRKFRVKKGCSALKTLRLTIGATASMIGTRAAYAAIRS